MERGALDREMPTTGKVAKLLRIAPRTVCLWAECSELPAIKVGRKWRFEREAVLKRLEKSQMKGSDSGPAEYSRGETRLRSARLPRSGGSE